MEDGYAGCAVGIYTAAKPKEVVFCNLSLTEEAAKTLTSMAAQQYEDNYFNISGHNNLRHIWWVLV